MPYCLLQCGSPGCPRYLSAGSRTEKGGDLCGRLTGALQPAHLGLISPSSQKGSGGEQATAGLHLCVLQGLRRAGDGAQAAASTMRGSRLRELQNLKNAPTTSRAHRQRLECLASPNAGAWITVIPTLPE